MHPLLNIAIQAARQASKIILRSMDRLDLLQISSKGRSDFTTDVDQRAEQEIIQVIHKAYPDHAILGEEGGYREGGEDNHICWVIDPLDGTTNYIHGFPHFATSIAVKQGGQLEVGVIYDPVRNELFSAARGKGATVNDRRIRVSPLKTLDKALLGTGFPHRAMEHFPAFLNVFSSIFPKCAGIRRAGSAALDLAYVAAGRLDGFWEAHLKEWDMAAGILIVQEAGGMIGDFQDKKNHMTNGSIIAANTHIYKAIQEIIQQAKTE